MNHLGIYLIITNPVLPYEEIAEICVEEQIKMLQLREKHLSDKELLSIGERIVRITQGTKTKFIINDRPDIAYLLGADGYHLGQDDLPLTTVRSAFSTDDKSKRMLTGLSTHNLLQLRQAMTLRPDYAGFGPIYPTPTKAIPDPVVGLELLKQALAIADIPLVAIGGIDETNIDRVLAAGAKNVALVRYFMMTTELRKRIRHIKNIIKSLKEEQ